MPLIDTQVPVASFSTPLKYYLWASDCNIVFLGRLMLLAISYLGRLQIYIQKVSTLLDYMSI